MSNITFKFKDLLPSLEAFKVFASESGIDIDNMTASDISILEHTYYLLYRRYGLSNVRYTTPEAFYSELAITFNDELNRYNKRYNIIQDAYKLSSDDLVILNKAISNYANNPNDEVESPLEPLSYISSQTFNANLSNKLQAYLLAIESLPTQYDEDFLKAFKHLFINIIPKQMPIYTEEG